MTYVFQFQATPTEKWQTDEQLLLNGFDVFLLSSISDAINLSDRPEPQTMTTYPQLPADPTIKKNDQTYHFTNSHYYNWYKNLQVNLLNSENFTHYFVRMQKNDPDHFRLAEKMLRLIALISFLEQLDEHDTYCLFVMTWTYFFNTGDPRQARDYLANFLTNYTLQKNDLVGLNQLTASLNQAMLQHFPHVRKQDLRLIYRLLELLNGTSTATELKLTQLNATAAARTRKCLAYLQDAKTLTFFQLPLLEKLHTPISFQLLNLSH